MSIFNNKNIIKNNNIPLLESFDMEYYGYKMISDLEHDSFNISLEFSQTVYTGLKSDTIEIVNEGFGDFFKRAAEFFKKLGQKIVEFAKRYMKYFVSYFQDFKRFLDNNKEFLLSLDIDFEYEGYEYDFPKDSPSLTRVHDIVSSYNMEINRIDSLSKTDVNKLRDEFVDETNKNKTRASVLNNGKHEITQDEFNKESKLLFRKTENKIKINVNKSYIEKIINEYGKMRALLEETEKSKSNILKLLNNLEYFFEKKASVTYEKEQKFIKTHTIDDSDNKFKQSETITSNYDRDKIGILNTYFDLKFRESRFISNCVITVYTDKINALKNYMEQCRTIVRQAITKKKEKSSENKGEVK